MSVFVVRRPARPSLRVLAGVLAASVGFACATVVFQPPAVAATGHLPSVARTRPLPHATIPARPATSSARPSQQLLPDSGWPAAGTAELALSSGGSLTATAGQPAGALPVRVGGSGAD
ncbi:MAG: hypothetical protein M3Y42_16400, partial [Actinomycetota bacterium]|nr:hypothetical protein [Actinomycetota bacterium]